MFGERRSWPHIHDRGQPTNQNSPLKPFCIVDLFAPKIGMQGSPSSSVSFPRNSPCITRLPASPRSTRIIAFSKAKRQSFISPNDNCVTALCEHLFVKKNRFLPALARVSYPDGDTYNQVYYEKVTMKRHSKNFNCS